MNNRESQQGLGLVGFVFVFALIGFFAIVTAKTVPLYLNQMKIARAVHAVAIDPDHADKDVVYLRDRLQRRWDIEDIRMLEPRDIAVVPQKDGRRSLKYDYEARENLFYNIFIVIHFTGEEKLRVVNQ
jgi:hypothetical protein